MRCRLKALLICAILMASVLLATAASGKVPLVVQTKSGPIIGALAFTGHRVFKGIPYAAPPVGELRWKAPQDPEPWKIPKLCDKFGSSCPSYPASTDLDLQLETFDEDCLYLNVWTPAESQDSRLPVMVYVHGGSFLTGSAAKTFYNGAYLAKRDVVVVTFNYRLGIFGFFCHPGLADPLTGGSYGNYGLLDQIAALKWVRDNIAAFGGDPEKVTFFGESAGAVSVLALMSSPLSQGLYRAAIAQSGAIPFNLKSKEGASGFWAGITDKHGIAEGQASLDAMRSLSWEQLLRMTPSNDGLMPARSTLDLLCIDGHLFKQQPLDVWRAGNQMHVPLIVGLTSDEMGVIAAEGPASEDEYLLALRKYFGEHAERIISRYPFDRTAPGRAFATLMGDSIFSYSSYLASSLHAKAGNPVFRYVFSYAGKLLKSAGVGAFHSSDILYLFGIVDNAAFPPQERDMARLFADYWTSFAKLGSPSPEGLPYWPAYEEETAYSMVLDSQPYAQIGSGKDNFMFWDLIMADLIEKRSFMRR